MDKLPHAPEVSTDARFSRVGSADYPARIAGHRSVQTPESSTTRLQVDQQLFDQFWTRLPFTRILEETGPRSHDQLAHAASTSLAKIENWQRDIRNFAETVCRCSIEYRVADSQDADRERAIDVRQETLVSRLAWLETLPSPLTARLMAKPLEDACDSIESSLRESCRSLIDDLFQVLDSLVDAEVGGTVERTGSTCQLHFRRQVIIPQAVETRTRTEFHSSASEVIEDRFVTTTSPVEYRLAYHEHHVMNVVEQPLDDSTVNIPEEYKPLIAAVPSWLRPHIAIIEGDLIRERIIEKELTEETAALESTVVTRTHSPAISYDPAITFGDYVLAGWGSRELNREAEQQTAAQLEARNRRCLRDAVCYGVAAGLLILFGTALILSSRANPSLLLLPAMLTALLGIASTYFSLEQYARTRNEGGLSSWFPLSATTTVATGTLTVQLIVVGFLYNSLWLLAAGGVTFFVFVAAFNFASNQHSRA